MSASSNPQPTALAPDDGAGGPAVPAASATAADPAAERFSVVPLLALSLSVFALCSAEFALIGLLLHVSHDLHVTVATAGQLLSAYAFAVAIGGPIVTVLTARVAPKTLALALLAVFGVANVLGALAPTFGILMGARTIGALTHSTFAAASILLAVRLSPPGRQASAIAWVAGGLGLATVLGGPIGTVIGETWGWRATFWTVAVAAVVGVLAIGFLVPNGLGGGAKVSFRAEVGALGRSQVLWAMGVTVVSQTGWFLLYSYITPLLRQVTGFSEGVAAAMLFVFGLGGFIGNALGGKLADRSLRGTIAGMLAVLAAMLLLIGFGAGAAVPTVIAVLLIGLASGALVPPLQAWALGAAGGGSTLVLAANTSAFNLGNAAGSWTGSRMLGSGAAVNTLAYVGAAIVLVSLIGALVALRARRASAVAADGSTA
ncbi:MFS transporter [Streptomyces sp. NPDC000151]|uniref:MFS transporter n=1 Tax=Streptomyces sp. NPDC000151 TaxID=3154244 RepID=UPI00332F94E9